MQHLAGTTFTLNYQLISSMKQFVTWESGIISEISQLSGNSKFRNRVIKAPPRIPTLSQLKPVLSTQTISLSSIILFYSPVTL
jgi:hypothetical protein